MTTLEAPAPAEKPIARTRLVLVEDSAPYARLVREMLRDAWPTGLDLRHFEALGDAESQLLAGKADCMLLDLGLADAQGLQAVGTVQALAPELPVVVLTTLDDEEMAVRAVKEGAQDYLVKGRSDGELIARAVRYAIERKGAELELAHQAMHDALTGLPNRALFLDRLKQALTRAQRHPAGIAVLFLDIDSFKLINDGLGHEAGDALLVEFGGRLKSVLRPSDTIARLGGDEFTIVCDQIATPYRAVDIAERVADAVAAPFVLDGREVFVTSSIGIALTQGGAEDPGLLLRNADAAMYRAKERGGARYEIFDELMRARAGKRIEIRSDLHRALRRDEFRLHYQPQVHLGSGRILGVEALLRWQHPRRGLLTAEDFIAVAEESGLIAPIGRWVLREACARLSLWGDSHGDAAPTVAVNISPRELAEPDFVETVEQALADSGATPWRLCKRTRSSRSRPSRR
jgi:diguanylate cyclase (GGDEF)-like protein